MKSKRRRKKQSIDDAVDDGPDEDQDPVNVVRDCISTFHFRPFLASHRNIAGDFLKNLLRDSSETPSFHMLSVN